VAYGPANAGDPANVMPYPAKFSPIAQQIFPEAYVTRRFRSARARNNQIKTVCYWIASGLARRLLYS
jgi:hypothetical protein